MTLIVAGIGTDVGKTIISAILCEALKADYWKPVQAGDLSNSDSHKVKDLVSNPMFNTHRETHRLITPISPHASARIDNITIKQSDFILPHTQSKKLVIEMAGGLMVPLSEDMLVSDFIVTLARPVILVSNYYLGSINHTLLSIDHLRQRNIPIAGIIFNGNRVEESRKIILKMGDLPLIADIPHTKNLTKAFIKTHAEQIQHHPRLACL